MTPSTGSSVDKSSGFLIRRSQVRSLPGAPPWFVYAIRDMGGRIYIGVSTDPTSRFKRHMAGRGAKFFRMFPPVKIIWTSRQTTKSDAHLTERVLKKLDPGRKIEYFTKTGTYTP